MASKPVGNFSAFLDYMNKPDDEPAPAASASPPRILRVLASTNTRQMAETDLRRACGMNLADFARAVDSFKSANLISVSGPPGDEVVVLTDIGAKVAQVA